MRVGSLFTGIGGFDLAAEWQGWSIAWQSEIDPYCTELLKERFPGVPNLGDITAIDWAKVERPDIMTGGFPCQDISYAGKGAGLAGARSGLWYEYARAVRSVGPRYVVVENVRALFTRGFDAVLGTLADLGYDAEWSMYGAADVGAPHRRHRVWILAYRNSGGRRELGQRHHAHRADVDRGSPWVDDSHSGRREQRGPVIGSAEVAGTGHDPMGNADIERRQERQPTTVATDAGWVGGRGGSLGWADAVPVRGHDGTVRLIPRQAAEEGPESPFWPVADGVPGRVARLRGIGNAIVPACAVPIYNRIKELERGMK